jgi:hypothetical protein
MLILHNIPYIKESFMHFETILTQYTGWVFRQENAQGKEETSSTGKRRSKLTKIRKR